MRWTNLCVALMCRCTYAGALPNIVSSNVTKPVTIIAPSTAYSPPVTPFNFPAMPLVSSHQGLLMIKPNQDVRSQILNHFTPITKTQDILPSHSSSPVQPKEQSVGVDGTKGPQIPERLCVIPHDQQSTETFCKSNDDQHVPPKKRRRQQSVDEEDSLDKKQPAEKINVTDGTECSSFMSPPPQHSQYSSVVHTQQMGTNTWSTSTGMPAGPQQMSYPVTPSFLTTPPPTPSPPVQYYHQRLQQNIPEYPNHSYNSNSGNLPFFDNPYRNLNSGFLFNAPYHYQRPSLAQTNRWYGPGMNYSLYGKAGGNFAGENLTMARPTRTNTPISPSCSTRCTVGPSESTDQFTQGMKSLSTQQTVDSVGTPYTTSAFSHVLSECRTYEPLNHVRGVASWQNNATAIENTALNLSPMQTSAAGLMEESNTNIDSPKAFYNLDLQPPKATSSPVRKSSKSGSHATQSILPPTSVSNGAEGPVETSWLHNLLGEPASDVEEENNERDWENSSF